MALASEFHIVQLTEGRPPGIAGKFFISKYADAQNALTDFSWRICTF